MRNPNRTRTVLALALIALLGFKAAQPLANPLSPRDPGALWPGWELVDFQPKSPKSVSYTHLTLPTIYSV